MLIFADGMEHVSEDEIRERWPEQARQPSRLFICKPEHQQYFELIGMEFVDDLTDEEQ